MTTAPAPAARRPAVGVLGLVVTAVGVLLVLVSFVYLDWYGVGGGADTASDTRFANLRHSVDAFGGVRAASSYFDWLSWTLLIAVIVLGALANVRTSVTDLMRVLGFLAGAAGVGATYYALLQYANAQAEAGAVRHGPLYNGSWGLPAVFGGFALAAVGAVIGPGRND